MVRNQLLINGANRAGSTRMDSAGKPTLRPADDLPFQYQLTYLDARFGPNSDMLMQGNDQF